MCKVPVTFGGGIMMQIELQKQTPLRVEHFTRLHEDSVSRYVQAVPQEEFPIGFDAQFELDIEFELELDQSPELLSHRNRAE